MMPARPAAHPASNLGLSPAPSSTGRIRAMQPAAIATPYGRFVTGGIVEITGDGAEWSATLRKLDRPGVIAAAYFADGVRDVLLMLEDGRRARARITGTTFIAASERVCQLNGLEPFA